jgi:hypothetical protein
MFAFFVILWARGEGGTLPGSGGVAPFHVLPSLYDGCVEAGWWPYRRHLAAMSRLHGSHVIMLRLYGGHMDDDDENLK